MVLQFQWGLEVGRVEVQLSSDARRTIHLATGPSNFFTCDKTICLDMDRSKDLLYCKYARDKLWPLLILIYHRYLFLRSGWWWVFSQWTFAQNSRIITRQSCIFLSNSTALPYHSTRASFYAQLNRQNNWSTTGMANKLKTCLSLRGMQAFCTTTSSRLVWAFLSLAGPSRPSPRRRSLDQW